MKTYQFSLPVIGFRCGFNKEYGVIYLGKHSFWFMRRDKQFLKWLYDIQEVFLPTFWSITLFDCDSGGRAFAWYMTWCFGRKQIAKAYRDGSASSDGPCRMTRITFSRYINTERSGTFQ